MAGVSLKHICKTYPNGFEAVKDFNLEIKDKEFLIFVGPSGCGKSTTLRMIAGLEEITSGELKIGDTVVNDVEPKDRDIAMVFQNYALYPHMTVYENMAFGLKLRKVPKDQIDKMVKEAAKILDLEQLLDRKPKALSGGQRQRVAMGRAIVCNPKVFLMDEPLSNLDAKLRAQMRVELLKLHEQLGTTMIYVTHDQTEAMTLGTKIVVMKAGYIQQVGAPAKIYNNPINLFVAGFLGSPSMNFFKCRIKAEADNRVALVMEESGQGKKFYLSDPLTKRMGITANGRQVILGIRPEDINDENGARELGIMNQTENMEEIVVNREMTGAETILYFDEQNKTHAVRLKPENKTQTGEKIKLYFDMEKIHIFDPETEKNLLYREEVQ